MFAIYKKELRSYFTSVIGSVFLSVMLIIISLFFFVINLLNMIADFSMALNLNAAAVWVILIFPILTMRIMAEENKQKTDQLLLTSPISVTRIVLGKYLALLSLYCIGIFVTCFYPLIMKLYGPVQMAQSYGSIFGFLLMGGTYIAIGMFISSLTESQVIAAVISFLVNVFTFFMTSLASMIPSDHMTTAFVMAAVVVLIAILSYVVLKNVIVTAIVSVVGIGAVVLVYFRFSSLYDGLITNIMGWFSIVERFKPFTLGIMNITSLVYYLSVIAVFLFLTVTKIRKKSWS